MERPGIRNRWVILGVVVPAVLVVFGLLVLTRDAHSAPAAITHEPAATKTTGTSPTTTATSRPTGGPVPTSAFPPRGTMHLSQVPDFVPALGHDGQVVGYIPSGYPSDRTTMRAWRSNDPGQARTTQGRWASSSRGSSVMPIVWTTSRRSVGPRASSARGVGPSEDGRWLTAATSVRAAALALLRRQAHSSIAGVRRSPCGSRRIGCSPPRRKASPR